MSAPVLELRGVGRDFGGLQAVNDVSFSVAEGERCVVLGPNGAGKTTLFHCATGTLPVSRGRIHLFDADVTRLSASRRARFGLGRTFQITNLFLDLTLIENVLLAVHGRRGTWSLWRGWRQDRDGLARAHKRLAELGLAEKADQKVAQLAYGERRQLELALALAGDPRLLFLDEPCAGLAQEERQKVAEMVKALPREITLVLVEHDMDIAFAIADRVVVMNRGEVICDGAPEVVRGDSKVREVYLGDA